MSDFYASHKEKLLAQVREAYGKVAYSERCHLEQYFSLDILNKRIKYTQIIFSSLSTLGFIGAVIGNETIATWVGGFFAVLLLAINLFYKDFNISHEMSQHRKAADELWLIREKYLSLLTDFDILDDASLIEKRDELQSQTDVIYRNMPKTNSKSFAKAQKALKENEEQFFSDDELNKMLPKTHRIQKGDS